MGIIQEPHAVKLISACITSEPALYHTVKTSMIQRFGALDFESGPIAFRYTDYYTPEMGKALQRYFISFKRLIKPDKLATIKILTNSIEAKYAQAGKRKINIDPGYITLAKLVLATTKDYNHRIYLQKGIYAEVTLHYSKDSFTCWDWTYPDYRSPEYIKILNRIREIYREQLS